MATVKELEAQIAKLEATNANLEASQPKPKDITVKVSPTTGIIVVSGLAGRYPTTLYRSSWKRLLTQPVAKLILNYIEENDEEITKIMGEAGKVDR